MNAPPLHADLFFEYGVERIVCKQIVQSEHAVFELLCKICRRVAAYPGNYLEHDEKNCKRNDKHKCRAENFVDYLEEYVVYLNYTLYNLYDYHPYNLNDYEEHYRKHNLIYVDIREEGTYIALLGEPVVELGKQIAHHAPVEHETEYQVADKRRYDYTENSAGEKFKSLTEAHHGTYEDEKNTPDKNNDVSRNHEYTDLRII